MAISRQRLPLRRDRHHQQGRNRAANLATSDWLVRRLGLKAGRRDSWSRRTRSSRRLPDRATILTTLVLVFLSLVYGGLTLQQPNWFAVCLDVGRRHAGAVVGFGNTAANAASAVSSVVFGYLVGHFGSYDAPLIPMVLTLCVGMLLWLTVDPTRELFVNERVENLAYLK
jgi:ACS family glucarate transporter-like MFS transporter